MLKNNLLIAAAFCSVAVAVLHIYVIAQGAWAYRYFGAGEQLASLAESGSWIPALLTSFITLAFFIFAAYYLAAADWLPSLPFLRVGLIGIAAIYTLRGAVVIPAWVMGMKMSPFDLWSSLVSLAIGLLHVAAVWMFLQSPSGAAVSGSGAAAQ